MMKAIKKILVTTIIFNISTGIHAYTWTMSNFTKKQLLVQIELLHSANPYFVLIPPRQSADFSWNPGNPMAGFCLGKIKYVVVDQKLLTTRKDIFTYKNGEYDIVSNAKVSTWTENNKSPQYKRKEAELRFMPDALFNQTVEEAKKLSGTNVGAKIVGWFANMIGQSKCRSRDIKIIEKANEIGFYTLAN